MGALTFGRFGPPGFGSDGGMVRLTIRPNVSRGSATGETRGAVETIPAATAATASGSTTLFSNISGVPSYPFEARPPFSASSRPNGDTLSPESVCRSESTSAKM